MTTGNHDDPSMQGVGLDFGAGAGVFDLTFSLPRGAILGMIGPSGCGKTTMIGDNYACPVNPKP